MSLPGIWEAMPLMCRPCIYTPTWCHVIDQSHKSQNAPVPYTTMHHSEQKCPHFCFEWCIVGYGTSALWNLWMMPIVGGWPQFYSNHSFEISWGLWWTKWPIFCRGQYKCIQMHSVDKNICHLLQNSHYFATKGSIDDKSSLIKVKCLAPSTHQDISTSDDPGYRFLYVSPNLNELSLTCNWLTPRFNQVYIMVANALAPCIAWSSAPMILTM